MLVACGVLSAQIPSGGILLNAEISSDYHLVGKGEIIRIPVTGQPFAEALRCAVGNDVSNTWDTQISFTPVSGFSSDDVLLVAFYARTVSSSDETGIGNINVCIEHNSTFVKELLYNLTIGKEWKQYYASVQCTSSMSALSVRYVFHCGFPSQVIEIADVRFLNYEDTFSIENLPIIKRTYSGQSLNAPWRGAAEERINNFRKGVAEIVVYDDKGRLLKGADVSFEMIRHKFGFGTAVHSKYFLENERYREVLLNLFNEATVEYELNWPQFEGTKDKERLLQLFDSLEHHNIKTTGHILIWPSFKWCPSYLKALSNNPDSLRTVIGKRIDDVTLFTRGRVVDWNVLNEAYYEHDLQDILGNEVVVDWFKRARHNDPGARLYINDYDILSSNGTNVDHQNAYFELIQYIDSLGGNIDMIGLQGHFPTELTPIPRIYSIIDRFASLGKKIKITEHDIDFNQEEVQADYTRDFLTITFSHPSVTAFHVWGFWEGRHWRPNGAFFNLDWSPRPAAKVWEEMIYDRWWTPKIDTKTDHEGIVSFEGYLGTYQYRIKKGENVSTGTFQLVNSKASNIPNLVIL